MCRNVCLCVCQIFFGTRAREISSLSLSLSSANCTIRDHLAREILVALRSLKKRQKHNKKQQARATALKSILFPQLKHSMFALSSKTSATPAFAVKKQQQNSRVVRATTKAVVNDSPRIIVENDAETKKFRLRDHQREVIRDMSDFAGGEVRASFVVLLFLTRARARSLSFSAHRYFCASPSRVATRQKAERREREREVSCSA